MRAWGFWLPDLEWASPKLREAAEVLETLRAHNPEASIEMSGEFGRVANELRSLVKLISEAQRAHVRGMK